tara:strand:+ start:258 stop:527 length:270 start_codon:yes stop_codon:yes gene_type:complete
MTDIEDIIKTIPDDSYIKYYKEDEDFLDDIRGYFEYIKDELPSSTISKWKMGDKFVMKITNFIQDEDDPITNGENYYIVMKSEQKEEEE